MEETVDMLMEARSRINGLHDGKLGHGLINGEVVDTSKGVMGNIHINPSSMGHASSSRINTRGGLSLLDPTRKPKRNDWGMEPMTSGKASPRKLYGASPEDADKYRHARTYKLVNVLDENGDPRMGIIDGLTEILKEATKDDAVLYNEEEMTDGEIREYISVVFNQLKEWFLEAKEAKEKGLDVTEHSTVEDETTGPMRYGWKDLKKEEDTAAIRAFQDRQSEFISSIVDAKDDPQKIAEAIRPAVDFQRKMHNVYKELALQVRGLEDDEFRGGNPMRIFIQDPDAIFVASIGFWRNAETKITAQKFGVGRQVDISKKTIVLMMPHRQAWNKGEAEAAFDEWKTRFNNGNEPEGTDIHRARTWVSNKAGTALGANGKPIGFSLKNYWVDVRFTAPRPGMPKDAFDEIIEKYSPKGAERFGQDSAPGNPDGDQPNLTAKSGINPDDTELDVYTTASETLVKAAVRVAKKFGVNVMEDSNLHGRVKALFDRESGNMAINSNQQNTLAMFASIIEKIADKMLHGGQAQSPIDDVENLVTVSSVLFNTRNDDIARVYLERAKEAAAYARKQGATPQDMKEVTMRTYKATAAITSELIADVVATNSPDLKKDEPEDIEPIQEPEAPQQQPSGKLVDDDMDESELF